MQIGHLALDPGHCYVMGILNVTPDSFSDGGQFTARDAALRHVSQMLKDGMDILDIGGESTRPGYTQISCEEEIARTVPVIEAIRARFDVPVSLDTYKWQVAKAGIAAGADMINDIWGLRYDNGEMASLLAETKLPCCLMHNRKEAVYQHFFAELLSDLAQSLTIAEKAGIRRDNILLDPGIGFAKSYENNLEAIARLDELQSHFGCPVLLGTSRKSVIGLTLEEPVGERLEGTLATTVIGVMKGVRIVRVHDVRENVRAIRMAEAVGRGYSYAG